MQHINVPVALLVVMASTPSFADTTIYSQRHAFHQQTGPRVVDTFEDRRYEHVMSDAAMSAVLGETQYFTYGGNLVDYNNIMPGFGVGKSKGYCSLCYGSFRLSFQKSSMASNGGVFGVGVDVTENSGAIHPFRYAAKVTFVGGNVEVFDLPLVVSAFPAAPNHQFWGITASSGIASVDFVSHSSAGPDRTFLIIDNLTITAVPVPEQSTLLLLLTGLCALPVFTRPMRRAASNAEVVRSKAA